MHVIPRPDRAVGIPLGFRVFTGLPRQCAHWLAMTQNLWEVIL